MKSLYSRPIPAASSARVVFVSGGWTMRIVPLALVLAAAATPALAAPQQDAERAVRVLQDPIAQEIASGVINQVVGVVLETRVGPLASVLDPESDVRPNDTLGDLKRRDDPNFERRLQQDTRRAVGAAAATAGGAMAQAGEIRRTVDRLEAVLGPVIAATTGLPSGR
jgi:hypothetical protein